MLLFVSSCWILLYTAIAFGFKHVVHGCWILDFACSLLDFGFWLLAVGFCWLLDFVGCWLLDFGFCFLACWLLDIVFFVPNMQFLAIPFPQIHLFYVC